GKAGQVLRNTYAAAKKDQPPVPPGFVLEVKSAGGKNPARLILRTDAKDGPQIGIDAPAAGWHDIVLKWRDGRMRLVVDDKAVEGDLPLPTLHINDQPGEPLQHSTRFIFGERGAAISA